MGFFDFVKRAVSGVTTLGKNAVNTISSVGKSIAGTVSGIGKAGLTIAKGASGALDWGLGAVNDLKDTLSGLPVVGPLFDAALASPIGQRIQEVFKTAEDASKALREAITIGEQVETFVEASSKLSVEDLKKPEVRAQLSGNITQIQKNIAGSTVGQKVSEIPQFQRQVDKFNDVKTKVENKIGTNTVERVYQQLQGV